MVEVEHVVPRNHGGAPLEWENFLLSCRYCNGIKSDKNTSRTGYIWPDIDNSDLAFAYSETDEIQPVAGQVANQARATIRLMGLDRRPGGIHPPTDSDSRWIFRLQAWLVAKRSFDNWNSSPTQEMASQIALTASGHGFFSVWMKVFENVPEVQDAIRNEFPGTYFEFEPNGSRSKRPNAII